MQWEKSSWLEFFLCEFRCDVSKVERERESRREGDVDYAGLILLWHHFQSTLSCRISAFHCGASNKSIIQFIYRSTVGQQVKILTSRVQPHTSWHTYWWAIFSSASTGSGGTSSPCSAASSSSRSRVSMALNINVKLCRPDKIIQKKQAAWLMMIQCRNTVVT